MKQRTSTKGALWGCSLAIGLPVLIGLAGVVIIGPPDPTIQRMKEARAERLASEEQRDAERRAARRRSTTRTPIADDASLAAQIAARAGNDTELKRLRFARDLDSLVTSTNPCEFVQDGWHFRIGLLGWSITKPNYGLYPVDPVFSGGWQGAKGPADMIEAIEEIADGRDRITLRDFLDCPP